MLSDTARKTLRILFNDKRNNYVPSISTLAWRAGRTENQIKNALKELVDKEFIEYNPIWHEKLKVLRGWEFEMMVHYIDNSAPTVPKVPHELWESF